jgi:hypothetical protein
MGVAVTMDRTTLLATIRQGLEDGTISAEDLRKLTEPTETSGVVTSHDNGPSPKTTPSTNTKLSIVDMLFYLAGIVLYAALMVFAFQAGGTSSPNGSLLLLLCALALWTVSMLGADKKTSDNAGAFWNAMLLTGSLSLISGGVMLSSYISGDSGLSTYTLAVVLAILAAAHLFFDQILPRTVLVFLGLALAVSVFPVFVPAMLTSSDVSGDVWTLVGIGTGVITAVAGYAVVYTAPAREQLRSSFYSIAGFIVLGSVYGATFGSSMAVAWSIVLPILIYLAFYTSIKTRSRNFLLTGSFYLVVFIITMSFKYFSGAGAAFSLAISAAALVATAIMASSIKKTYLS